MSKQRSRSGKNTDDFDLDSYLDEKANAEQSTARSKFYQEDKGTSKKRNLMVIGFFIGFMILYGIIRSSIEEKVPFGVMNVDEPATVETTPSVNVPSPTVDIAPPPPPAPPATGQQAFDGSYIDYFEAVTEAGLGNDFSGPAIQSFYSSGVPIDYLVKLKEAGFIDEFSYPAIVGFYSSGVQFSYLEQLQEAGLISDFSYPAIISLSSSGVTMDYLLELNDQNLLNEFSYPAIISLYSSDVSMEYLTSLNEAGFLNDLSYPAIISFYQSEIPVSFLQE